jgi:hypothetical protein
MTALTLDVVSKVIVAAKLGGQMTRGQQPVRILFGAIYLDETRNSGAAFSVGTGATVVLTVVAVAVIAIILRTARRMRSAGWAVSLGLVLGGALGNLVDRLLPGDRTGSRRRLAEPVRSGRRALADLQPRRLSDRVRRDPGRDPGAARHRHRRAWGARRVSGA